MMNKDLWKLRCFDFFKGNRIALGVLSRHLGWRKTLQVIVQLQLRMSKHPTFKAINLQTKPTAKQLASQHQMTPVVVMYEVLQKFGLTKAQALKIVEDVVVTVGMEFLTLNIPVITKAMLLSYPKAERLDFFKQLVQRFFNSAGEVTSQDNAFYYTVTQCDFAQYSMQLGVPELAYVFCLSDQHFFDQKQPSIRFKRQHTLAIDQKPCDFSFEVID